MKFSKVVCEEVVEKNQSVMHDSSRRGGMILDKKGGTLRLSTVYKLAKLLKKKDVIQGRGK